VGTGGTVPPKKFEVGVSPCIRPQIFGEVVLSEQSKKGVFLVRKGSYTTFNIVKSGKRKRKSENAWSITKKGHQNFCRENGIFYEILVGETFFRPPQTSAPGLRHCCYVNKTLLFVVRRYNYSLQAFLMTSACLHVCLLVQCT